MPKPTMETITLRVPSDVMSQISEEFLQGMVNRMAVSFHKYGDIFVEGVAMDWLANADLRKETYQETGNREFLMDFANYGMIEFMMEPDGTFFEATDSDGSPGRVTTDGEIIHGSGVPSGNRSRRR